MVGFIFLVLVWTGIFTLLGLNLYRHLSRGLRHVYRLHQVPCSKCAYFTDSCYLKCTVNPHIACSESAIDCRDFQLSN